jgi:hypothetical protein
MGYANNENPRKSHFISDLTASSGFQKAGGKLGAGTECHAFVHKMLIGGKREERDSSDSLEPKIILNLHSSQSFQGKFYTY